MVLRLAEAPLTAPDLVAPVFTGLYMDKMVGFLKLYFPVFVLGAVLLAVSFVYTRKLAHQSGRS